MNLRSDCADGIIRGLNSSSPPGASRSTALICPPMEIGRLHGGDTCSNPPQRKMTFLLRLQFRTARFLLNRSFAQRSCVVARGVHPTTSPWRPPDYEKENRALVALAGALVESPFNILQTLAETILDVTQCDSSGLSLLTKDDGGKRFYWPAIAGEWKRHIGGGTPRDFGPCGDVLDQNRTLLFRHFERRYPYFIPITPTVEECLLVPFYVGGKAVGTIWAITHGDRRKFDSEDERIMNTLGQFASLAYQTVESIEDLKLQIAAREQAETAVRALASGLEAKIRRLVDSNIIGIFIWNLDG